MAKNKTPEQQALEKEVKKQRKRIQQFVNRAKKRGYTFSEKVVPSLPKKITDKTLARLKKLTPEVLYQKAIYVSPEGTIIQGNVRRARERVESSTKAAITRQRYYEDRMKRDFEEQLARQREMEAEKWLDEQLDNDYNELWYDKPIESQQGEGTASTPETDTVLRQIEDMIENWTPSPVWSEELADYKRRDKNLLKSAIISAYFSDGREAVAARAQAHATELISLANTILYDSGSSYRTRGVEGVNQDIQQFKTLITGVSPTILDSMEMADEAERLSLGYE